VLVALAVAAAAAAFAFPPIAQDPAYHDFADRRRIWGVPNTLNVLSNLPFTVVGALGVSVVFRRNGPAWQRAALLALFGGVGLTGFGSAWYHLAPTTAMLFWDRLPMTIAFMALLALTLGERVSERAGPWLLPLCLAAGVGSVTHWQLGERVGAGDLRLYALVQFFPMLAIPLALALYPRRWIRGADLLVAVGWYALSKSFEALDAPIFALGDVVSGHTLKHLAAAGAAAWLLRVASAWRAAPS
jgi:hypothetical protein